MNLGRYRKTGVALLGAAAVIAAQLPADAPSWLTGLAGVVTALAVWLVPNKTGPDLSRVERVVPGETKTTYEPPRPPSRPLE